MVQWRLNNTIDSFNSLFALQSKFALALWDLQRTERYDSTSSLFSSTHDNWHKQQVLFNCKSVRVDVQFMQLWTLWAHINFYIGWDMINTDGQHSSMKMVYRWEAVECQSRMSISRDIRPNQEEDILILTGGVAHDSDTFHPHANISLMLWGS